MSESVNQTLPEEAEEFLKRLGALSLTAWREIMERVREPLIPTIKRILRGLWVSILPAQFNSQFHGYYSRVAADRLRRLAESGVLPMQDLSWRGYEAAGTALQALCLRGRLEEEKILEMYAPFESYIPLRSLHTPGTAPSASGSAGA